MKTLLLILSIALSLFESCSLTPAFGQCGTERWNIKTLTDSGAKDVKFNTILVSSIEAERRLIAPIKPKARTPQEKIYISISATLIGCGLEADGDFHLVLADSKGLTMIGEISNPECSEVAKTEYAKNDKNCRAWVESRIGKVTRKFKKGLSVPVTVSGVRFFDKIHGQNGVAPNGVECRILFIK